MRWSRGCAKPPMCSPARLWPPARWPGSEPWRCWISCGPNCTSIRLSPPPSSVGYERVTSGWTPANSMRVLGTAAFVAGVPVITLVVLALMRQIAPGPALVASTATSIAAVLLAARWYRDLGVLRDSVKRIADDEPIAQRRPELPGLQRLGADLERL